MCHKSGEKIDLVYFPGGGVCSITNVMSDGRMVEVATIGNEGMVGVTAFLGGDIAVGDAFVQVEDGPAQAMTTEAFHRELDRRGPFYDQMSRYAQAYHALIMQSAACFSMHSVEERCCRWLLMTHDRAHRDEFQLTHELLSYMLGARRPTVSLVLGTLERTGAIQQRHQANHHRRSQPARGDVVRMLCRGRGRVRTAAAGIGPTPRLTPDLLIETRLPRDRSSGRGPICSCTTSTSS